MSRSLFSAISALAICGLVPALVAPTDLEEAFYRPMGSINWRQEARA